MIERYSRPELARLWSPLARYEAWLAIELAACAAMEDEGTVPAGTAARLRDRVRLDPIRILEIEATVQHDVIAFLTQVEESAGPDARWLHLGMTSSDVLDTSFAWLLTQACDLCLEGLDALLKATRRQAFAHQHTVRIGRSHGMHAEPTTFGHYLAILWDELRRGRRRLAAAREAVATGQISGAVGTFANVSPAVEARICQALGLRPAPASSQIVQRDRHAELFCAMALVGGTVERFAVEVRHGQRSEVGELAEPFGRGQKGSSAMPHKRNPILSENLSGLARLLRGYALSAMENMALWHERDISHSSVERVIGPDGTTLLHFMLHRATRLMEGLVVRADRMRATLESSEGLIYSQGLLLELIRAGVGRQQAYSWIQRNAMAAREGGASFAERVLADEQVRAHLSPAVIARCFDPGHHVRRIDLIFERVFGSSGGGAVAQGGG